MKSPSPFNTYSIGDNANTTGNTTSQKNSMKISSKTKVEKGKSKASRAIKMLRVLPQYKILLGTTFADKYLMMWDLETYTSTAIDMTANLPRNSGTFNNSSMATSTFVEPGGKFLFVGFDDGGFTVNSLHFDTDTRELERIVNPYTLFNKIFYDDTQEDYSNHDVEQYRDKYVKLIVVNKKDLYAFDKFVDRLLTADAYEVKIIEDFSELDANNVSDDIVENTEDTMTLLEKYVDELDVTLDKTRLKNTMRTLYNEAQDLEL